MPKPKLLLTRDDQADLNTKDIAQIALLVQIGWYLAVSIGCAVANSGTVNFTKIKQYANSVHDDIVDYLQTKDEG